MLFATELEGNLLHSKGKDTFRVEAVLSLIRPGPGRSGEGHPIKQPEGHFPLLRKGELQHMGP